jgi:hypothetical protein
MNEVNEVGYNFHKH